MCNCEISNQTFILSTAGSKLHTAILEGFESLHKYIHSGDLEELDDLVPHEDFTDYTAEDFIADHAEATVGDEEDIQADPNHVEFEEEEEAEPRAKRFRGEFDSYDNESNDYDSRYSAPGIPSLLNLHLPPPRPGSKDDESSKSPTLNTPWEGNHNNNNSKQSGKDRREGRRGSRWSSTSRR